MLNNLKLDHYAEGITVICLAIVIVVLFQIYIKKQLGEERIRQCHEVGGHYLAIVGSFYAVLLGLIVFSAMDKFIAAEKTVEQEGKSILAAYTMAAQFDSEGNEIQNKLKEYTNEVVKNEWELMESDQISMTARKIFLNSLDLARQIEPQTENQKGLYPILMAEMINTWESRRDRTKVSNMGIPVAEWVILILGAIITLIFTLFFTIDSQGIHLLMTGMIALLIFVSLYLVLMFGAPFSVDMRVSNHGLVIAQKIMNEYGWK
jgi:hypothetical protein